MKKIICFIISLSVIFTMSANVFAKQKTSSESGAVYLCQALGFIEDNAELDRELTRGELAKIIAQFTGYTESGDMILSIRHKSNIGRTAVYDYGLIEGKPLFSDVPAGYWGVGFIEYVALQGYMGGSKEDKYLFEPNKPALPTDLYEPLVRMLGYGEFIEEKGISQCAAEAKINVAVKNNTLTTRNVAEILYKALHAELYTKEISGNKITYQKEGLLMQELFDMGYEKKVRIETNPYTSIIGDGFTRANTFKIGGEVYNDPQNFAKDALGYVADLYYTEDEDGERTAVALMLDTDENITVVFDDVVSLSKEGLVYYNEKGARKSEKISLGVDVLYNNQLLHDWTYDYISSIRDAEYTFADTNNDNEIDLIKIKDYKYIIVDSVNQGSYTVKSNSSFKNDSQGINELVLDKELNSEEQYVIYTKDGETTDFSGISPGTMLCVLRGKGENGVVLTEVEITASGKTLTVDSYTAGDKANPGLIVSGGKEYKLAPGFYDSNSVIMGGKVGKAYMTKQDKIFKFIISQNAEREYGFLRNIFFDEDNEEYIIKIFTQDSTWAKFKTGLKVIINDTNMKIVKALNSSGLAVINTDGTVKKVNQQLIRYTYSADKIVSIDTLQVNIDAMMDDESLTPEQIEQRLEAAVEKDEFRLVHVGKKNDPKRQLKDLASLNSLSRQVTKSSSIKTFCMPDNPEMAMDDDFAVKTWPFPYNTLVNCESYDEDMFGVPKAMIYYSGAGGVSDTPSWEYLMVRSVSQVFDEEVGEVAYKITGLLQGKEVSYNVDDALMRDSTKADIVKNLTEGSLVRVARNTQNRVSNILVVFDINNYASRPMDVNSSIGSRGQMSGTVVKVSTSGSTLRIMGNPTATIGNNCVRIATMAPNPYIMLYDGEEKSGNRVKTAKFSEVSVDDYVIIRTQDCRMDALFIYKNVE